MLAHFPSNFEIAAILLPSVSLIQGLRTINLEATLLEHTLMLIPLIWLKVDVDRRNAVLEGSVFKPVPDEDLSTYRVNLLLALGILMPFVSSLLQTALAYAFYKYGHPWSGVLKTQVFQPPAEMGNDNSEVSRDGKGDTQNDAQEDKSNEPTESENDNGSESIYRLFYIAVNKSKST